MKYSIDALNLRQLTSGQSLEFLTNSVSKAQNDEKVSAKFAAHLTSLQTAVEDFDVQYRKVKASDLTKDVESAKSRLRKCYRALALSIASANTYSSTDAAAKSAQRLQMVLNVYKIDAKMNQLDMLNDINNLIDDFSSDSYSSDVKAAGAESPVKALMHEVGVFKALLQQRNQAMELVGSHHLTTSRHEAEAAYRSFIRQVNAVMETDTTKDYDTFVEAMKKDIQFMKQSVIAANKRAKTIAQKKKETPEDPITPDAPTQEMDSTEFSSDSETDNQELANAASN